jgi:hypothetical protein
LLALAGRADSAPVAPSPTADQVLSIQYHAHGEQGAMSGQESQAVADAYRRDIAKPAAAPAGPSSNLNGGEMSSH